MPPGDEIVVEDDEELIPMQPTSIALAVTVVTEDAAPESADVPDAVVAGASTPEAPE
jgi:hypothetical protein